MSNGDVTKEVKAMLEGGKLNTDDALRLLLVMVDQVQSDVAEVKKTNKKTMKSIEELESYNAHYPSMLGLWYTNPRKLLVILIIIFLVYTFIITPWMISDIRHVLLELLNLPQDLGIPQP